MNSKSEIRNPKSETISNYQILNFEFISNFGFRASCSRTHRGFTLIEAVIALALVGAALVAVGALAQSVPLVTMARDEDIALKIATTKIEELRAGGYAALPASGPFTDSLMSALASSSAQVTIATFNPKTKQVDVRVSWVTQRASARSVSLTTLMTETGGL